MSARALPLLAPAAASAAGEWLTQRSLPGGGWALLEGDEAEVYATGLVLVAAATSEHPGLGLAAAGGRAWLADQQGPDGCFGPDELSCAVVAEALAVGGEDPSAVAAALLARQGPSGAWDGGDPYSTARALAALVALGPNLWAEALTLAPESPPRGGAATATLRVRNAGWASAAAFTVRLTGRASADPPLAAEAHRDFKGPMSMLNLT